MCVYIYIYVCVCVCIQSLPDAGLLPHVVVLGCGFSLPCGGVRTLGRSGGACVFFFLCRWDEEVSNVQCCALVNVHEVQTDTV